MLRISSVLAVIVLSGEVVSLFFIFSILNMYNLSIEMFNFSSVGQLVFFCFVFLPLLQIPNKNYVQEKGLSAQTAVSIVSRPVQRHKSHR